MVLGIDVHKGTHTAVVVDEVGRGLGEKTVRATDAGHRQLLRWVLREWSDREVRFAVEDCRHVSTRLERALLAAGQAVVRVPPKLMAGARSSARTRGTSDPSDALAIARAALREPGLPVATHDSVSREVKLLVDHREDLVGTRTREQNRLRWHLHELDPAARGLDRLFELDRLATWLEQQPGSMVVRIATELVADIRALPLRANALERELAARTAILAPRLLALPGCGPLTAAKIVGETANVTRFRSVACFAMHADVAPSQHRPEDPPPPPGTGRKPTAQRRTTPHRRDPDPPQRTRPRLHQRRRTTGDTTTDALRAPKRHLARTVYDHLQPDTTVQPTTLPTAA